MLSKSTHREDSISKTHRTRTNALQCFLVLAEVERFRLVGTVVFASTCVYMRVVTVKFTGNGEVVECGENQAQADTSCDKVREDSGIKCIRHPR